MDGVIRRTERQRGESAVYVKGAYHSSSNCVNNLWLSSCGFLWIVCCLTEAGSDNRFDRSFWGIQVVWHLDCIMDVGISHHVDRHRASELETGLCVRAFAVDRNGLSVSM